jgi:hypothetical protein
MYTVSGSALLFFKDIMSLISILLINNHLVDMHITCFLQTWYGYLSLLNIDEIGHNSSKCTL